MIKKAFKPLGHIKTLAKKTRAKAQAYLSKRPHRSFRPTNKAGRKTIGATKKLPSVWAQIKDTNKTIWAEKWLLAKLGAIFALTTLLFVGGVSQLDYLGLKDSTLQFFGGDFNAFANTGALFLSAVTGTISAPADSLQQFLLLLISFIFWLACVWAIRMKLAGNNIKVRDALYNACAPLVSSSVLMFIVALQLMPAAIAMFLFAILQSGEFITGGVEVMMFSVASLLLFLLSMYWLSASTLALIVVTLPGMYPWRALSVASELVIGQRWAMAIRLTAMALIICLLWALVLLPALLLDGYLRWDWLPLVPIVVQLLGALSLVYGSVYVYKLYRSLL